MIIIPAYILVVMPVVITWWTHRRCDRREFFLLTISFLISLILLVILDESSPRIATRYDGPLAASGILTSQIVAMLFVTTFLTILPARFRVLKLIRDFAAVIVGEAIILRLAWIS